MELLYFLGLIAYGTAFFWLGFWRRGRSEKRMLADLDSLFGGPGAFETYVKSVAASQRRKDKQLSDAAADKLLDMVFDTDCETEEDDVRKLLDTPESIELFNELMDHAVGMVKIDWDDEFDRWAFSIGFPSAGGSSWGTYTGATPMEAMLKAKDAMPKTSGLGWPS